MAAFNLSFDAPIQRGMEYILAALLAFLTAIFGQAQDAATTVTGTWTARHRASGASARPADPAGPRVYLELRTTRIGDDRGDGDWSSGQNVLPDELAGLPALDERFSAAAVKFELRREAGTFAFEGAFRDGRGAGLFTFSPRAEYASEMKALGYSSELTLWRRFRLAVNDIGPRHIRALRTEGYTTLTLDEIERGRNHGVTLEYVRALKDLGYRDVAWATLIRTRDHGVTPAYIDELKTAGYANLPLEQLVRTRDHGVTSTFIQAMRSGGFAGLPLEQLVRAKDHGVNDELLEGLSREGFKNVPIEDVIRVKDHGVSADYIADMKGLGLKDLTLAQIVRLRDHGVTPGFVNHARARGYKESTVEGLIRLKNRGLWDR